MCVNVKEVSEVPRGEGVNGLEGGEQDFIGDTKFNWKLVELLQARYYMTEGGGFGDNFEDDFKYDI